MDEKNIEVKVADDRLTVKGEKQEEKQEKKKDYYLHFGSFERSFDVPETVDADKIEASFKNGVLAVTLPKKPEAQKPAKKIEVKAAESSHVQAISLEPRVLRLCLDECDRDTPAKRK